MYSCVAYILSGNLLQNHIQFIAIESDSIYELDLN